MNRWIVAAAIPLVFGIALAACGESGGDTTFGDGGPCPDKPPPSAQIDADMSVDELTDLVAKAMTCPGHAIHLQSTGDYETEDYAFSVEFDAWVDVENNVARTDTVWRAASEEALRAAKEAGLDDDAEARTMVIYLPDARYTAEERSGYPDEENQQPPPSKGQPASCNGVGREALGSLILCEGPLSDWEMTVEIDVSFRDRAAIALLTTGESSDSDSTWTVESWLYFDANSLLPLGGVNESTAINGGPSFDTRTSYEYGFVPLDSLPMDFFDPASIGYVEPDPEDVEKPLDDAEIAVYWLGREFAGEGGYPSLAIRHANVRPEAQTPEGGYIAEIVYRPADDEFGHYLVRIDLLTPAAWEYREERTLHSPCEETRELDVDGHEGTVKIHHWGSSQDRDGACLPPDRYSAVVHFDDVVVDIDAPATGGGGETFYSPYDSEEGIEMLVRSLELRE